MRWERLKLVMSVSYVRCIHIVLIQMTESVKIVILMFLSVTEVICLSQKKDIGDNRWSMKIFGPVQILKPV